MSDYILDLRKIVGHRPLLQVGASVIVVDSADRILLQRRADNHLWGYAGGSVELDEEVEQLAFLHRINCRRRFLFRWKSRFGSLRHP